MRIPHPISGASFIVYLTGQELLAAKKLLLQPSHIFSRIYLHIHQISVIPF